MDIDAAWRRTCTVLLGGEAGALSGFEGYLREYLEPMAQKKSSISGKPVAVSPDGAAIRAQFISSDEIRQYGDSVSKNPISINELKDFDSLLSAARERAAYCGNIVLGNSGNVAESNRCMNVWHAYRCSDIYDSKFLAYCSNLKYSEYVFGTTVGSKSQFCIKASEVYMLLRCMETIRTYTSSDCYYAASCEDCKDCLFSFCLRNKQYCIGNNQFPKEKYAALKGKLLSDMLDVLGAKKRLPTIVEIINGDSDEGA